MKLEYKNKNMQDWFLVSWTLSNKCNYRCEYCPDILHNGSTGQPRWETVKRFVENFKVDKTICYRLSGGEPTYWKHFLDLAKLVKKQGHYFSFVTNGSQRVKYYKEISKYTDGFMISYHPQYADVEHFINIANEVDCPVAVNLMLVPDKFDDMCTVAEQLYHGSVNLTVLPKVVVDKTSTDFVTNEVSTYTQDQKEIIANWKYQRKLNFDNLHRGDMIMDNVEYEGHEIILQGKNKFSGWRCWAGLDGVNIDMWGNLYRADCQYGGALGNLERYKLPKEELVCGKTVCSCLSDIYIRKEQ
jgi:organic radical activating enzyme